MDISGLPESVITNFTFADAINEGGTEMDLKILFFGCYFWSIANNQIIGPPGRKQQYSTAADYEVRNRVLVFF